MRKIINTCTAIKAVVLIFALIAILLIWPVRVFSSVIQTSGGGGIVGETDRINFEHENLMQPFMTQYDRLSSVDVYVTQVEKGRYISCLLYDENGAIVMRVFVDTEGQTLPGYVNIPMEVNVEVGKTYTLKFQSCRSKYFLGLEDIPADNPYLGTLTDDYVPIEGRHVAAVYNYRLPLSKGKSLLYMGIIAAAALVICLLTELFFKKNPKMNHIVTVGKVFKIAANPVAAIVLGALMIMVFPLKLFDSRPLDIVFYELGLIITAAIVFYGINHKAVKHVIGISFWQTIRNEDRVRYVLMMFSIAMALWYACVYMNDLYDIYHHISERHMAIWLIILMLLTFSFKEAVNIWNLLWVALGCIYGAHYYNLHKMAETEKEYDLNNTVLKCGIIIVVLGGLVLISFIRLIVQKIKDAKYNSSHDEKQKVRPTLFGIMLLIFFVMLVALRNTRLWGIYLALTFVCLYIRLAIWDKKEDYYKILSGGLMMNFALSLGYSWLHRYFAGYTSGRFAFIFHTVTVTAEYLTFMGAAASVMIIVKLVALPKGTDLKDIIISAWKEMTLFGFIMSYAIFTVSRTAYLAIAFSTLLVILVVMAYHRKQLPRLIGVFALSIIVCFPAAFTLQRILPTICADPVFYVIDDADEFVRGGADWDCTNFMCVERFANLFESKILGADVGTYEFPIDKYNYENEGKGEPLYDYYGRPYADSPDNPGYGLIEWKDADKLLAAASLTRAEYIMLMDELQGYVDTNNALDVISNGRITIFRSYIQQLNLWGHEEMGVMLPNGEIAVHAHNTYIQVAHDHGIVVGCLFVVILVSALGFGIRYYGKNRKKEPLSLMTSAIVIGFMVAGISEWVFQYCNPMTVALMLSLAPLTYRTVQKNK